MPSRKTAKKIPKKTSPKRTTHSCKKTNLSFFARCEKACTWRNFQITAQRLREGNKFPLSISGAFLVLFLGLAIRQPNNLDEAHHGSAPEREEYQEQSGFYEAPDWAYSYNKEESGSTNVVLD
jgi:hypothetical protein